MGAHCEFKLGAQMFCTPRNILATFLSPVWNRKCSISFPESILSHFVIVPLIFAVVSDNKRLMGARDPHTRTYSESWMEEKKSANEVESLASSLFSRDRNPLSNLGWCCCAYANKVGCACGMLHLFLTVQYSLKLWSMYVLCTTQSTWMCMLYLRV